MTCVSFRHNIILPVFKSAFREADVSKIFWDIVILLRRWQNHLKDPSFGRAIRPTVHSFRRWSSWWLLTHWNPRLWAGTHRTRFCDSLLGRSRTRKWIIARLICSLAHSRSGRWKTQYYRTFGLFFKKLVVQARTTGYCGRTKIVSRRIINVRYRKVRSLKFFFFSYQRQRTIKKTSFCSIIQLSVDFYYLSGN